MLQFFRSCRDVSNIFILTYRVSFLFFEETVIPCLRHSRNSQRSELPRITILADATKAREAYLEEKNEIKYLGRKYRVVPIVMRQRSSFHSKAVFLSNHDSAKERFATLFIGSGDVTPDGWQENDERWVKYRTAEDGVNVFAEFKKYVNSCVSMMAYQPRDLREAIDEAFDDKWPVQSSEHGSLHLLGCPMRKDSLLDQFQAHVDSFCSGNPIDQIYICSPFFDKNAKAISAIVRCLQPNTGQVLTGIIPLTLWQSARQKIRSLNGSITFQKATLHRGVFLHLKFYAVRCRDRVMMMSGSANCTVTGLLQPCGQANAELMTLVTMSFDRFRSEVLNQFQLEDMELSYCAEESSAETASRAHQVPEISIASASKQGRLIEVHYQSLTNHDSIRIDALAANSQPLDIQSKSSTTVVAESQQTPESIRIIASSHDSSGDGNGVTEFRSPSHWVDDLDRLQQTAPISRSQHAISDNLDEETGHPELDNQQMQAVHEDMKQPKSSDMIADVPDRPSSADEDDHIEEWVTQFCSPVNFSERSVDNLVGDIQSAFTRLCLCLSRQRMERDMFSRNLILVMSSTLIHSSGDRLVRTNRKWTCWWDRLDNGEFRKKFCGAIVTSRVAAAVGLLAVLPSPHGKSPELAAICLCAVLSLCRLFGKLDNSECRRISKQIADSQSNPLAVARRREINTRLRTAILTSWTLRTLDHMLLSISFDDLLESVNTEPVIRGDLGWQPTLGYCVVENSNGKDCVSCLAPHRGSKVEGGYYRVKVVKDRLVSINALLREGILAVLELSTERQELLSQLVAFLRRCVGLDSQNGGDEWEDTVLPMLTSTLQTPR